ncbi:right-handed parallel beta-helix repeat-containing protein [Haloarcula amylovorans]|uniref:right-handed parallel beta-helix repeat-containing protein n=1 Tax=Haloarcula amylovorans TaxID=2562280 RepID=UPI001FD84B47|nr:right-handed parallel beta-helix repeat-containing protein [Halomicroarcula amylolytica]
MQAGVDATEAGDLVLVAPGTYYEAVTVSTPDVTVRGRDRNAVVLDGEFERGNAIEVGADGVALENLTARYYRGTAFYWTNVDGFRGSFLTAYNNGYYGIYAYNARDGRFEHSYASGHPDAGFYLGRNRPYDAVVTDVVAEHNAIGYSGTSTGGPLTVSDSVWRHNKVGIFPNTLDRADPPQSGSCIVDNEVYANNNPDAPALPSYPLLGMGILLWGGSENVIAENHVREHDRFGIVAQPHIVEPSDNEIRDNHVEKSQEADLALGQPAGGGNRFHDNTFMTSLPADVETAASGGSEAVTDIFTALEQQAQVGDFPTGNWRDQPIPGDQPSMPNSDAPPRPATKESSWEASTPQTDGYGID